MIHEIQVSARCCFLVVKVIVNKLNYIKNNYLTYFADIYHPTGKVDWLYHQANRLVQRP